MCDTPRVNARCFEKLAVGRTRSNILTENSIRDLVKVVDEKMDGVATEQRRRLEIIEPEPENVKKQLGRIRLFIRATNNIVMADAVVHIRERNGMGRSVLSVQRSRR